MGMMFRLSKTLKNVVLLRHQLSLIPAQQQCGSLRQFETHLKKDHSLSIEMHNDHLQIVGTEHVLSQVPFYWLRDHCRCSQCFNTSTNQRNVDILEIPLSICPITWDFVDGNLRLEWSDGHISNYCLSWLQHQTVLAYKSKAALTKRFMWRETPKDVAHVPVKEFLHSNEGLIKLTKSLITFGIGFVEGVEPDVAATEKVVQRVGPPMRTLFGDIWEMKPSEYHEDTAYSTQALGAHTDNTYFTEAAGLQVFHILKHEGEGGRTLLVDGFRAALDVKTANDDHFKALSHISIPSEYLEPKQHHSFVAPVLRLHPITRELQQIRFNLYDRASMNTVPYEGIMDWYRAMRALAQAVRDPAGECWLQLQPGQVLFVDNWRVLHGRSAYTGLRWVTGAYISRTDYLSCARVSGALDPCI